jgi:hypothetical protein
MDSLTPTQSLFAVCQGGGTFMKKETQVKYQSSANLFKFCRLVLDKKFGGIRVIDQDVGQILGFDPADCSHWKKGKKNIRSIQAMKSIAEHLGVDERLVVDIANGEMDDQEAFFEITGYGDFVIDENLFEQAKKQYYRKNVNTWTREKEQEFRHHFSLNETKIDQVVRDIHEKINFNEAPLYLPEITNAYPDIALVSLDKEEGQIKAEQRNGKYEIGFPGQVKMKPYLRYGIAKAMGGYFFAQNGMQASMELGDYADKVADVQANLFAAKLLTPAHVIRRELKNLNSQKDIISQLAETFWVSKTFMNFRLKEILQSNPEI